MGTPQRHGLLGKHRLDGGAGRDRIETALRDQIAAIFDDRVGVLHHLQPLEVVVVCRPILAPTISSRFITRNG